MPPAKLLSLFFVALANFPLLAQPVDPACLASNGGTNAPAYLTRIQRVSGPGLLPANFAYITFDTNKFGFVMPEGFRLETEDREKVTLVNSDFNCLLTFRVLEPRSGGDRELDSAYYRQLLLNRHPGGKIIDEFSLTAVSQRGPAFDLRWNAAGTVPQRERVLFIPSPVGVLEFSLVTSLEKFEARQRAFSKFLITFRAAEPDGRLVMPVLSDRF